MPTEDDGVFTVDQLAGYLQIKRGTIYKHMASRKLPGFKVGAYWRFKREAIDRWIAEREGSDSNQKTFINQ